MQIQRRIFLLFLLLHSTLVLGHTEFLENEVYSLPTINKIPKIIHQIWVGKRKIPNKYVRLMATVKNIHPDWEYHLWTDENIDDFPWINKAAFSKAKNPGMKSDIWRMEILYKYGGVYLDTDIECIRPLDLLHEKLTSYFPTDCIGNKKISNHVIGAAPNLPLFRKFLEKINQNIIETERKHYDVICSTGPIMVHSVINHSKDLLKETDIVFHYEYFQPISPHNSGKPLTEIEKDNIKKKCFVIHHNGCSWMGTRVWKE